MSTYARSLVQLSPNFPCNFKTVSLSPSLGQPACPAISHTRTWRAMQVEAVVSSSRSSSRYRHVAVSERRAGEFLFSPLLN